MEQIIKEKIDNAAASSADIDDVSQMLKNLSNAFYEISEEQIIKDATKDEFFEVMISILMERVFGGMQPPSEIIQLTQQETQQQNQEEELETNR